MHQTLAPHPPPARCSKGLLTKLRPPGEEAELGFVASQLRVEGVPPPGEARAHLLLLPFSLPRPSPALLLAGLPLPRAPAAPPGPAGT